MADDEPTVEGDGRDNGEAMAPASAIAPLPAARLGALFEVLACSDYPTQLLVGQVLVMAGLRPTGADGQFSAAFVFALSLIDAVLLVALACAFLVIHGERPRDVLFGRRRVAREALVGLLFVPAAFLLATLVLVAVRVWAPSLHNVSTNPLETLLASPARTLLFGLTVIVSGGLREEVQRAFILHRFEQHLGGARLGVLLSSLAFGTGHLIQGWDAALATAALGAFWGCLYLARRSIAAPAVSHAGFDLLQILNFTLGR
jgi:uncharacterized protein